MRGSSRRIWTARSKPSVCMKRSSSRQVTPCGRTWPQGSKRSTRSGRRCAGSCRRTSHRIRLCRTQKAARGFYGQMRIANSRRSRPGHARRLARNLGFHAGDHAGPLGRRRRGKKKIAAEIKKLHTAFRTDVVQPFLAAWRQYIYRLSITLLTTARAHAARERRRGNTLNYGDLLQLAARVLRGNAEVRRALQGKYRWLFVDEFQDTDPVQAEIIFLLAAGETNGAHDTAAAHAQQTDVAQAFRPTVDSPASVVSGFSRTRTNPSTGDPSRSVQARCSSSAIPSSRSTVSVARTSTSTTSFAIGWPIHVRARCCRSPRTSARCPPCAIGRTTCFASSFRPRRRRTRRQFAPLDAASGRAARRPSREEASRPAFTP